MGGILSHTSLSLSLSQIEGKCQHISVQRKAFTTSINFKLLGKDNVKELRKCLYFIDNTLKLGANKTLPRRDSMCPATMIKTCN